MKTPSKLNRKFASALLAATIFLPMASMAQQKPSVVSGMPQQAGAGLPVPSEVPDGSVFILFGPHWGQKATVSGGRVPTPPPGAYGNFQLPSGSWYPVSVTPPSGWRATIMGGRCNGSCPAGVTSGTFALIAP